MSSSISQIFYTDDDRDDHDFFAMALQEIRPGAQLHPFYSCGEILAYLKNEANTFPDIIFLDQNIHGNINNECLQEIKAIAALADKPVIIYTTSSDPKLIAKAIDLGAYKYVIKPTDLKEIKDNLNALLFEFENRTN